MDEGQIRSFVKRGKKILVGHNILDCVLGGAAAGCSGAALTALLSLFIPLYQEGLIEAAFIGAGLLAGILSGIITAPRESQTVCILDRTGLSERLATAYERFGRDDIYSRLQREETRKAILEYPLEEKLRWKIPLPKLSLMGGMAVLALLLFLIPTQAKENALERHELAREIQDKIERIEMKKQEMAEISKQLRLDTAGEEIWDEMLRESMEEWKQIKDKKELEKSVRRLDKKLEQEFAKQAAKKLASISDSMRELGSSMDSMMGSPEDTGAEKNRGEAQREELLSQLGRQAEETAELADSKLLTGLTEAETAELAEAAAALSRETGQDAGEGYRLPEAAAAAENLRKQLAEALDKTNVSMASSASGQTDSKGSTPEAGSGAEAAPQEDTGGEGTGGSGEDSRQGSGSGSQGASPSSSAGGSGWDTGDGKGMKRENLPTLEEEEIIIHNSADKEMLKLTGTAGAEGDDYRLDIQGGAGLSGTAVNYGSVIAQYRQKAVSRIENGMIPSGMENIIKSYFEGLTGNGTAGKAE